MPPIGRIVLFSFYATCLGFASMGFLLSAIDGALVSIAAAIVCILILSGSCGLFFPWLFRHAERAADREIAAMYEPKKRTTP